MFWCFLFEGWVGCDDIGGFLAGEGGEFGVFECFLILFIKVKIKYSKSLYFIGYFLYFTFIFIGLENRILKISLKIYFVKISNNDKA